MLCANCQGERLTVPSQQSTVHCKNILRLVVLTAWWLP